MKCKTPQVTVCALVYAEVCASLSNFSHWAMCRTRAAGIRLTRQLCGENPSGTRRTCYDSRQAVQANWLCAVTREGCTAPSILNQPGAPAPHAPEQGAEHKPNTYVGTARHMVLLLPPAKRGKQGVGTSRPRAMHSHRCHMQLSTEGCQGLPRCAAGDPCLAKGETWMRLVARAGRPEVSNDKIVTKVRPYRLCSCVDRPCQQWTYRRATSPAIPQRGPGAKAIP